MKALSFSCSLVLSACECRHCAECFQGFGRADHAVTADLLRKKYSDYASIVWKDDWLGMFVHWTVLYSSPPLLNCSPSQMFTSSAKGCLTIVSLPLWEILTLFVYFLDLQYGNSPMRLHIGGIRNFLVIWQRFWKYVSDFCFLMFCLNFVNYIAFKNSLVLKFSVQCSLAALNWLLRTHLFGTPFVWGRTCC